MVHRRDAEGAKGESLKIKTLRTLCASAVNPVFSLWLRLCCAKSFVVNV